MGQDSFDDTNRIITIFIAINEKDIMTLGLDSFDNVKRMITIVRAHRRLEGGRGALGLGWPKLIFFRLFEKNKKTAETYFF